MSDSCVAMSPPASFTIKVPPAASTFSLMLSVSVVRQLDMLSVCEKPTFLPSRMPLPPAAEDTAPAELPAVLPAAGVELDAAAPPQPANDSINAAAVTNAKIFFMPYSLL